MTRPCTVWWAAPVSPDGALALVGLLDAHERERLSRFRRDADRARYLAAHALARLTLGAELDRSPAELTFDRTCRCGEQHGKPRLDPGLDVPGLGFSMTHAGDLVGVAVHSGAVGLDVEHVRPLTDLTAMADHVCSPTESAPDAPAFFRLWTRKEALLKATGDGLSTPMSDITLGSRGVETWTGAGAPAGPVWLHDLHPAADHVAAVAGFGTAPQVVEADGDALLHRSSAAR